MSTSNNNAFRPAKVRDDEAYCTRKIAQTDRRIENARAALTELGLERLHLVRYSFTIEQRKQRVQQAMVEAAAKVVASEEAVKERTQQQQLGRGKKRARTNTTTNNEE